MIMLEENDSFVLAGDWHGSLPQAEKVVKHAIANEASVIVHLGDFGIWDEDMKFPRRLNYLLQDAGITLYFVDGNHENFPLLYTFPIEEDGTRKIASNIFHLPRGFRFEWAGTTFLALGGAASIDITFREAGKSWWPEEVLTDEDIATAIEGGKVDVMLCHDSPSSAPNSICDDFMGQLGALRYFGTGFQYATDHRTRLQEVTDKVAPAILFHGHYHRKMEGRYGHADGSMGYVYGLDQGSSHILQSTLTVSPKHLADVCNQVREVAI